MLLTLSIRNINAQHIQNANAPQITVWKLADLQKAMRTDQPTIINFWATFCKPCIEEMPYFQEMANKYRSKGVNLVFVSLDVKEAYPAKLKNFLNKRKINQPVAFLDETDADLFCPAVDEKWSGAIPATLFINNKKGYRKFFEDQLSKEQLEKHILEMLAP
jgi:thiol-disulfide isomerase/thioredoxin